MYAWPGKAISEMIYHVLSEMLNLYLVTHLKKTILSVLFS